MHAKIDRVLVSLDNDVKRSNAVDDERVRLLISEKRFKRHLQLCAEGSEQV